MPPRTAVVIMIGASPAMQSVLEEYAAKDERINDNPTSAPARYRGTSSGRASITW